MVHHGALRHYRLHKDAARCIVSEIPARKTLVDAFHRNPHRRDTRTGIDCQFCQSFDPEFGKRTPMDKLVYAELNDEATAHMTEDGYVRHRILEMTQRRVA